MKRMTSPPGDRAAALIDELRSRQRVLAQTQAQVAGLMVEFTEARRMADKRVIADRKAEGGDARFKAAEFAAREISMAVKASKRSVERTTAMTHRMQMDAPDAWDAWQAGDIDQEKAIRINRALRCLVFDRSKEVLNTVVVDVAVCRTPEILGRWLNQFIAQIEPDQTDERLRRSLDDRYVSIRPDVDGVSFLSASMSAVNATAVDQVLTALAAAADAGDLRTLQQRRADALVDVLLGRVSNGCHVVWDTNDDSNDYLDEPYDLETHVAGDDIAAQVGNADTGGGDDGADKTYNPEDQVGITDEHTAHPDTDGDNDRRGVSDASDTKDGDPDSSGGHSAADIDTDTAGDDTAGDSEAWDAGDWEQPASVFRPDPRNAPPDRDNHGPAPAAPEVTPDPLGRAKVTQCPGGQLRPVPVTIGVVVSMQSLFGYSNTPGQLIDRSAMVPADTIRDLAARPGTLFYRLLTDEKGNLLDVREMGRFPSRKLGMAIRFRDGICENPSCTVPAARCDLDHLVPVPDGATTGKNLGTKCRSDHRAKTHAGHRSARTGPHTTAWTTPSGHTYIAHDEPLPVEEFPDPP